jgi:peroxiredoxin Q/BCP
MLKIGEKAPLFSGKDQDGNEIKLDDYLGKKNIVLFFYPKDDTPVCTAEACSFRDNYDKFRNLDTEIIGVNQASVASHKNFAEKYRLTFPIINDEENKIKKLYKVPNKFFVLAGRVTYVIDKQGLIKHAINNMFDGEVHITETLKSLKEKE